MFRHQTRGKPGLVSAAPLTSESSSGSLLLKPPASAEFGVRGKQFLPLLSHGCVFFVSVGILLMDDANHRVFYKFIHACAAGNHLSLWDSFCLFAAAAGASWL